MSVVINDFEVVTEAPPSQDRHGGDKQEGEAAQAQGPTPHQIERVIEHHLERRARVRAH
jgi:hypothetical protein